MFNQMPFMMPNAATQTSLLNATKNTSFLGKINWSSLLSNTQKTLNVVNQVIPLYYQVKPVVSNIRTLGKIGKEFNKSNINNSNNNFSNNVNNNDSNTNNNINISTKENNDINNFIPNPTFFI